MLNNVHIKTLKPYLKTPYLETPILETLTLDTRTLETVVREGLVGFCHAMHVFALLNGRTFTFSGI